MSVIVFTAPFFQHADEVLQCVLFLQRAEHIDMQIQLFGHTLSAA